DSEVFGYSQVNSEHCRHKIFNGTFIIDGKKRESTLFQLIKRTAKLNPNFIVSAYSDNCALIKGPTLSLFHPQKGSEPSNYIESKSDTVITLKAETHNYPTTVEPFGGASTGAGGEIRDRMAGGQGAIPSAGFAVYMTPYSRLNSSIRDWESKFQPRKWLYQLPKDILLKATCGASHYGNMFGQPLICGSLLTYELFEEEKKYAFDKVIMLAGGVGYTKREYAFKERLSKGDKVVMMGGDNYRIGMGGGAVSSVETGEFDRATVQNAIQRANPEIQKRVFNVVRALVESTNNVIVSIHDHGAGGHLNCFSELVEGSGGKIDITKLPIGDSTLSAKEIISNESQERMGLVVRESDLPIIEAIAKREEAPIYVVGESTQDNNFTLYNSTNKEKAVDLNLSDLLGSLPPLKIEGESVEPTLLPLQYDVADVNKYIELVLQLDSVACKDWITNKVDRSATALIAAQQTVGELQLPLGNVGVVEIGYGTKKGMATSIGHAPAVALIDAAAGSRVAIARALTNLVWAPLTEGLKGVSLSANWMWPCKNRGEEARLYSAVESASNFAVELGINIPTGKDSLSMTQNYPNGDKVLSPGTVIISTVAEADEVTKVVKPPLKREGGSLLFYIPFNPQCNFNLGGSALSQILSQLGNETPDITDSQYFANTFMLIQQLVREELILSGHDISAGGIVTTLLESTFANTKGGIEVDLTSLQESDSVKLLFSESPAAIIEIESDALSRVEKMGEEWGVKLYPIGKSIAQRVATIKTPNRDFNLDIEQLRDIWYNTSYLYDSLQTSLDRASQRYDNYKRQPLKFNFPELYAKREPSLKRAPIAAVVRERGSSGERELAWVLHLAGFIVKDVHMSDLIGGKESLEDVDFLLFAAGASHSNILGGAKGWSLSFKQNPKALTALHNFYKREGTLSMGVANGAQLMMELSLLTPPNIESHPIVKNSSAKYESAFIGVAINNSPSILLSTLQGSTLGAWFSNEEGKFKTPTAEEELFTAISYSYKEYPGNPANSEESIAALCSRDGRHLATMVHPERGIYPHTWGWYPKEKNDQYSPWIELFVNGRKWFENREI
ncbi:MAG: phosphoribosylformylglycinamidine synthase, partial [Bacteroidales bacterium]